MASRQSPSEAEEAQPAKIFSDLSTLFLSERYSDVTIVSRDRMFPAHRAVICSQCPYFETAIRFSPMGLHTPVLTLPDSNDPDAVTRLLQFLYSGNYDDGVLHEEFLKGPSEVAKMSKAELDKKLQEPLGVMVADGDKSDSVEDEDYDPDDCEGMDVECDDGEEADDDDDDGDEDEDEEKDEDKTPPRKENLNWDQSNGEPPEEFDYSEFDDPDEMKWDGRRYCREFPTTGANRDLIKDLHGKRSDLVLHCRLHLMANRYQLPALSLLTRDRFYRAAELAGEHFPAVVAEIYDAPVKDSAALREIAGRIIANNVTDDEFRARLASIMGKHADLAVDVMNVLARRARDKMW